MDEDRRHASKTRMTERPALEDCNSQQIFDAVPNSPLEHLDLTILDKCAHHSASADSEGFHEDSSIAYDVRVSQQISTYLAELEDELHRDVSERPCCAFMASVHANCAEWKSSFKHLRVVGVSKPLCEVLKDRPHHDVHSDSEPNVKLESGSDHLEAHQRIMDALFLKVWSRLAPVLVPLYIDLSRPGLADTSVVEAKFRPSHTEQNAVLGKVCSSAEQNAVLGKVCSSAEQNAVLGKFQVGHADTIETTTTHSVDKVRNVHETSEHEPKLFQASKLLDVANTSWLPPLSRPGGQGKAELDHRHSTSAFQKGFLPPIHTPSVNQKR